MSRPPHKSKAIEYFLEAVLLSTLNSRPTSLNLNPYHKTFNL